MGTTIEDSWRPWFKGKVVKIAREGEKILSYTVDELHEVISSRVQLQPPGTSQTVFVNCQDGDLTGQEFEVAAGATDPHMSEIELANVLGQSAVETSGDIDDLTVLTHLHEPEILLALELRYNKGLIYTATGAILLAVNPFKVKTQPSKQ